VTFGEGLGMTREQVLNHVPSIPMRMGIQYWDNVSRTRPWLQRVRGRKLKQSPDKIKRVIKGTMGALSFIQKEKEETVQFVSFAEDRHVIFIETEPSRKRRSEKRWMTSWSKARSRKKCPFQCSPRLLFCCRHKEKWVCGNSST